jgi:hypothetical protein
MTRPRGVTRAAWQRRQKHTVLTAALVFAALISAVVVIDSGSNSPSRPSCEARTINCRETADGFWVPLWYYGGLALAQGTAGTGRVPSTAGPQPSASQLQESGATSEETNEAESYDDSASSAGSSDDSGSDDSGSDDSDDGGGDGGGDGGD